MAQDAAPAPPSEVCLTNACSNTADLAIKTKGTGSTAPAAGGRAEVALGRAQAQMSFMEAGYYGRPAPGSTLPEGSRVDLKTSLRTETGEVLTLTISPAPRETGFNHSDPSGTPYMIGASIEATGDRLVVQSAFRLNGQDVLVPSQSLTAGQPVTVNLPDGRQLTMTANLRPETDRERSITQATRARMEEMMKSMPPPAPPK